jgi:hypothetical protein
MDNNNHIHPQKKNQSGKPYKVKTPKKPTMIPIQEIEVPIGWLRLTLSEIACLDYPVTGRIKRRA